MDPDAALERLRELSGDLDGYAVGDLDGVAYEMAEAFQALDEWLTSVGFRPRAWVDGQEDH